MQPYPGGPPRIVRSSTRTTVGTTGSAGRTVDGDIRSTLFVRGTGQKNNILSTNVQSYHANNIKGFLPSKTTSIAKQTRTPTLTTTPVMSTLQRKNRNGNGPQPRGQPGDHGTMIMIGIGVQRKLMKYIGKNDYKALFSRHKAKNSVFGTAGNSN